MKSSRLSGILLMVQASAAFAAMSLCVKMASRSLGSMEIVFIRSVLGSLMIGGLMLQKGVPFWGREKSLLITRGLSGFVALSLNFYTIGHLPLGAAVLLNSTSPIFSAFFAATFLGEKFGLFLASMIAVSFGGVALLVEGSFGSWNLPTLTGLVSAIFAAAAYVSIRAIRRRESPLTVIFYFTAVSTVGSAFFIFPGFRWPNALEWLWLAGVAVGSFYGQLWMTISLRRAPASLAMPFTYLSPLLCFVFDVILFGVHPSLKALAGALLIILSGVMISYRETQKKGTGL